MFCIYCKTSDIVKNWILKYWWQRYRCKKCYKSFTNWWKRWTYLRSYKLNIVLEYCHKNMSAREIIKKYNISTATLIKWSKKHKQSCNVCKKS